MRDGADAFLVQRLDREPPEPGHKLIHVYGEMLVQICRDYNGLPDARTLTMAEIRFFYNALRPELKKATAPKNEQPKPSRPRRRK